MIYWENLQRKNSERKIATDDDREKKGDMVSLLDSEDAEVVSYRYSSWGKILEIVDTSDNQIEAGNLHIALTIQLTCQTITKDMF